MEAYVHILPSFNVYSFSSFYKVGGKLRHMFAILKFCLSNHMHKIFKQNSGALVRQRTIPTERPPLVGEVNANFSG
jgi:hypothetical protein